MKNHLSGLFRCSRLFVLFFGFTSFLATAQVGINTTSPEAMLDVVSSNSGLLIPRVALTSTTVAAPVVGPTESEMVFNTSTAGDVTPGFYYYWDGKWVRFSGEGGAVDPGNSWQLEGNAGTVPGTGNGENFLGTTDAKDLHIATDKNTRLIVKSDAHQVQAAGKGNAARPFYSFKDGDGKAGMYLNGPNNNLLSFSTDGGERFRIGNKSGEPLQENIRSMLTHVFENGTAKDPSIVFKGANLKTGLSMPINAAIAFSTTVGSGSNVEGVERMRITENGVGINVTNPTEKLHVDGNIRFEGALMPGNAAGNSGQVLLSRGNDAEPEWGADLDGIQKIYQAVTTPVDIAYGDVGIISVGPIDPSILTRDAAITVSIKSSQVGSQAPYNINIHSVLVNDTHIEIGYDNLFDFLFYPENYTNVVFNITIIR